MVLILKNNFVRKYDWNSLSVSDMGRQNILKAAYALKYVFVDNNNVATKNIAPFKLNWWSLTLNKQNESRNDCQRSINIYFQWNRQWHTNWEVYSDEVPLSLKNMTFIRRLWAPNIIYIAMLLKARWKNNHLLWTPQK